MPAGESVPEMVRGLLGLVREAGAKVKLVLLDREFFSTGVIQALTGMSVGYLMPCPNTPGVVEALNEFAAGQRQSVSDHRLEGSGRRVPYHLIIADRKRNGKKPATLPKERFIGFATSVPDIDINLYSARRGMETGYAMIEAMRAKTRSRDSGASLLCFLYSLMVFNGWVMVNSLRLYHSQARLKGGRRMTQTTLKILLLMAAGSQILPDPPPDALPSSRPVHALVG